MKRRDFVAVACGGLLVTVRSRLAAQQPAPQSMTGPMDSGGHRPVKLPPRAGAVPLLDDNAVKHLESGLKCSCGTCRLDVYICRTTDFTCPVSPAMHRDVLALVAGGYSADEIVTAFVDVYGESVRMAPKAEGFNLIAYLLPFMAMGTAAILVGVWILKTLRAQREHNATLPIPVSTHATAEELDLIDRAVRDQSK